MCGMFQRDVFLAFHDFQSCVAPATTCLKCVADIKFSMYLQNQPIRKNIKYCLCTVFTEYISKVITKSSHHFMFYTLSKPLDIDL